MVDDVLKVVQQDMSDKSMPSPRILLLLEEKYIDPRTSINGSC